MKKPLHVCVYCGSSPTVTDVYRNGARAMGELLVREGLALVYGGGCRGLMGIVADTVMDGGGRAIGIIPKFLQDKELINERLTELHVVSSMHERKQMMADRSDAFVVLPGGFGTLDEFFEILTWRQLGLHDKPILLVNINGYWDPLMSMIDRLMSDGFARAEHRSCFSTVERVEDLTDILRHYYGSDQPLEKARL